MSSASQKLEKYFRRIMGVLPESFVSSEPTSLLFVFFGTIGLDLISKLSPADVDEFTEWVYDHQIRARKGFNKGCGFRGSSYLIGSTTVQQTNSAYDCSHVTMVYNALCILLTLGDDLSRVDRASVLQGISALQCDDEPGLFRASLLSPERDMRFIYSAVASCYILDGLDVIDRDAIISFIDRCCTYEGGFGQLPGLEAHAGATYCAVASLALLDALHTILPPKSRRRDRLIKWLISLQGKGFHGRMHKPDDTCYTFWVCASLRLLGCESFVDRTEILKFAASAWDDMLGGIRKYPDPAYPPDPLHTYLCLSGLACLKAPRLFDPGNPSTTMTVPAGDGNTSGDLPTSQADHALTHFECFQTLFAQTLHPVRPELNVTESTFNRLKELHRRWRVHEKQPIANKLSLENFD